MPRSFNLSVESSASVDQVLSAFGNVDYWQARLAIFGAGTASLGAMEVSSSGTVTVEVTMSLLRDRLPKMVTRLHRGDLAMGRTERWSRIEAGRVRGDIDVVILGAPVSVVGQALLAPATKGSQLSYATTVAVGLPLVGGKIESYLGTQTGQEITAIQNFTTEWIARNG